MTANTTRAGTHSANTPGLHRHRLVSIDALRGFDMLLIAGGGSFIILMHGLTGIPLIDWMADQMEHAVWRGFTFYDFIFPLFLFLAGVSMPFSVGRSLEKGMAKSAIYRKGFQRACILVGLGIIYSNAPLPVFEPAAIRLPSVLGRIGIAGFLALIIYVNLGPRPRLFMTAAILLIYYALMFLVPVPGYGAGDLSFAGNLHGYIDRMILPGRLADGSFDELGLLTQLPSIALPLLGTFAGEILKAEISAKDRARRLVLVGILCIAIGLIWGLHFPVMKKLWTSSYILVTGGMSFIAMAMFYWLIDIRGWKRFGFFFQVIGLNSLAIYMLDKFLVLGFTTRQLFGGFYAPLPGGWEMVLEAIMKVLVVWALLYVMYRVKLFIKV